MPTSGPTPSTEATAASTPRERRYQVRSVLWGNRKRFVVRDTATDTTVAIRTTSELADSDLLRLGMAPRIAIDTR